VSRYSRWDGTQDPFGPDLAVDDLADRLAEDVLDGWGIDNALRRLLQEGMKGRFDGLRRLRERIEELRAAQQARSGRQDPLGEFRRRLDDLLAMEQEALALDPSDDARVVELDLAMLPENLGSDLSMNTSGALRRPRRTSIDWSKTSAARCSMPPSKGSPKECRICPPMIWSGPRTCWPT
jgi:uncharacterized protein with von Willebrand factor type A (vWA) domain